MVFWNKGLFQDAYTHAKEALSLHEKLGGLPNIAYSCFILAKIEYALNHTNEAKKYAKRAYNIFSELKMPKGITISIYDIAELLESLEKFPDDPSSYLKKYGVPLNNESRV